MSACFYFTLFLLAFHDKKQPSSNEESLMGQVIHEEFQTVHKPKLKKKLIYYSSLFFVILIVLLVVSSRIILGVHSFN